MSPSLAKPSFSRVLVVSRQARDAVRTSVVDKYLPLHELQSQARGLAREDEIACANINWRKQQETERKAAKALLRATKADDPKSTTSYASKESKKPPAKRYRAARK
jgi:hypothetical protein